MIEKTIIDIVKQIEDEDRMGNTEISKYVSYSQRENIEKIDAYLNSKHISGDTDSMDRDKPFFNISVAASNIWYRATDIDRKNIKLKPTKKADFVMAFVMTILLQEWMRKNIWGIFLNEWGRILARYGSAVTKFIEKSGKLISEVIPWNRLLCDPIDFDNNVKIERLWYTAEQLRAKEEYDQAMVEDLIEAKTVRKNMDGQKKDNKAEYIELFEVHGRLPLYYLTGKESDEKDYVQQMHIVSYIARKEKAGTDEKDEFTLFSGKEAKDPYRITHLIKEDGRTMAIGAVEHMFESQWMLNHSQKAIKDQLDLASKLIFQTSDGNFVGQNALTSIENGDIMVHQPNQPLTQVANNSHDIGSLQSFGEQWKALGNEINGINEAMTTAPKSNTAWRQTQAALVEAHSLFGLMIENKGLGVEEMLREDIFPYLKKKLDTTDEISAILEEYGVNKLDSMYVPAEASKRVNKAIINDVLDKTPEDIRDGKLVMPEQAAEAVVNEQDAIQKALNQFGNQRFIKPSEISNKTWKQAAKNFVWDAEVDITGENKDYQAVLTTLNTALSIVASLNGQPMPPEMKLVFNKILTATDAISPVELAELPKAQIAQPIEQPIPEVK